MDLDKTQSPSTTADDLSFGPVLSGVEVAPESHLTPQQISESQQPGISQALQTEVIHRTQEALTTSDGGDEITSDHISGNSPGHETGPTAREAEAYADDLARELINDTNQLVREEQQTNLQAVAKSTTNEALEMAMTEAFAKDDETKNNTDEEIKGDQEDEMETFEKIEEEVKQEPDTQKTEISRAGSDEVTASKIITSEAFNVPTEKLLNITEDLIHTVTMEEEVSEDESSGK